MCEHNLVILRGFLPAALVVSAQECRPTQVATQASHWMGGEGFWASRDLNMRTSVALLFLLIFSGSSAGAEHCAVRSKVIGGWRTSISAWPSFAGLRLRFPDRVEHICGGTVIAPEWVLTAGHCILIGRAS